MDTRDELLIQNAHRGLPKEPKCPGCDHTPLQFACNTIATAAGHIVAVLWCGDCGYTLNTQFVGMQETQISRPGPMIVRPT